MNRRETLLSLLALGAAARAGAAGEASLRKLGILSLAAPPAAEEIAGMTFLAKLRQLGWVESQNLSIVRAYADLKRDRLPALAEDLVRQRMDVIFAVGAESAVAAARATTAIPIVFGFVGWPIEMGLIDSFRKPGRNVTGVSSYAGQEVTAKRHEYLREIAPAVKRLSWIRAPDILEKVKGGTHNTRPFMEAAVGKLGYEVKWHDVHKPDDVKTVFSEIVALKAQALSVAGSAVLNAARQRIADFALEHQLPSTSVLPQFAEAGGLLYYGQASALSANMERIAEYVDQVLRGARPGDLPVDRPSRYELIINLRTAKVLGLHIPQVLLLRADRVIE